MKPLAIIKNITFGATNEKTFRLPLPTRAIFSMSAKADDEIKWNGIL